MSDVKLVEVVLKRRPKKEHFKDFGVKVWFPEDSNETKVMQSVAFIYDKLMDYASHWTEGVTYRTFVKECKHYVKTLHSVTFALWMLEHADNRQEVIDFLLKGGFDTHVFIGKNLKDKHGQKITSANAIKFAIALDSGNANEIRETRAQIIVEELADEKKRIEAKRDSVALGGYKFWPTHDQLEGFYNTITLLVRGI